jgi:hypothetical protein
MRAKVSERRWRVRIESQSRQQKVIGPMGVTDPVMSPPDGVQVPAVYVGVVADLLPSGEEGRGRQDGPEDSTVMVPSSTEHILSA